MKRNFFHVVLCSTLIGLFNPVFASNSVDNLSSNEVSQNLHNINNKINQIKIELSRQQQQQQSLDNAIKYSDSAIDQSNNLLQKLKKQKELSLEHLTEIQNNLNSLNQSLEVIKKDSIVTTNVIYQQIQQLKIQDQSILSGNDGMNSQRKKMYLISILQTEQDKLAELQNKINSLNTINQQLQYQIDRLNKQLGLTKKQQQQLHINKEQQLNQAQSVQTSIQQAKSKLINLKHQQVKLNQLMDQIIAREEEARKKSLAAKSPQTNKNAVENNDTGYEDNSPFLSRSLVKPIDDTVALGFGQTRDNTINKGLLFNYVENAPIKAISAGKVMYSGSLPGFGKVIVIDHGNNYMSIYSGVIALVKVGDKVNTGQVIAHTGSRDSQPLGGFYFELRHLGKPINPSKIVDNT